MGGNGKREFLFPTQTSSIQSRRTGQDQQLIIYSSLFHYIGSITEEKK